MNQETPEIQPKEFTPDYFKTQVGRIVLAAINGEEKQDG